MDSPTMITRPRSELDHLAHSAAVQPCPFGSMTSAHVLLGPTSFCRRDTAIQNCFSNTMIPSTSPFGVLRWLALVSVLPSAESVYLPRTLNSSAFPSTVNASPSHFAVALT